MKNSPSTAETPPKKCGGPKRSSRPAVACPSGMMRVDRPFRYIVVTSGFQIAPAFSARAWRNRSSRCGVRKRRWCELSRVHEDRQRRSADDGGTFRHRDSIGWRRAAIVVRPSKRALRSIKSDAAPPSHVSRIASQAARANRCRGRNFWSSRKILEIMGGTY